MRVVRQEEPAAKKGDLQIGDARISPRYLCLWAVVFFVCGAIAAILFDLSVAGFCLQGDLPGDVRKALTLSELFAHGFGVLLILLCVYVLVPGDRWKLPRVVACAFGAGLVANVVKLIVARVRPHEFQFAGEIGATFVGWLPAVTMRDSGQGLEHAIQSFPSGHTATAVGLAIGLSWLYPHGRRLWILFATLAALQRIQAGAHWPSDVFAGAGLACLFAAVCFHERSLGGRFSRWESRGGEFPQPPVVPARKIA